MEPATLPSRPEITANELGLKFLLVKGTVPLVYRDILEEGKADVRDYRSDANQEPKKQRNASEARLSD